MKQINDYVLDTCNDFIKYWNEMITKYGVITLGDVKDYLCDFNNQSTYRDDQVGWTNPITTDNFVEQKTKYSIRYKLNLPEYKELWKGES